MPCYKPMIYWEDTKGNHTITAWNDDPTVTPGNMKKNRIVKRVTIPCGQCLGCRIQHSKNWATRLALEAKYHEDAYFVTLTYDEEHIHNNLHGSMKHIETDDNGEVISYQEYKQGYLYKKDLQDFWKRVRRHYEYEYGITGIKYYVAGEYGEETNRPHYHAIIYGMPLYDLVPAGKNEIGQPTYNSEELAKLWGNGFIDVGMVTYESCAYTARYITKKWKGKDTEEHYAKKGMTPEFSCMSQGIGRQYLEDHWEEIYNTDEIIIAGYNGKVKKGKPPRYFDNLYDLIPDNKLEQIKKERQKVAEERERVADEKSSLPRLERLKVAEQEAKERYKAYRRNKV